MAPHSPAVEVLVDVVGWSGLPRWMPDWRVTEKLLGLTLPDDYKALLDTVPMGEFAGTVLVAPPTLEGREGDLLAMYEETMLDLRAEQPCPYQAFPALPGLIPWAEFSHPMGGALFWLADRGDPNNWPVIAWGADGSWEEYDAGAVAFLIALVRGKLPSKVVKPKAESSPYRTFQDLPGAPSNTGR